MREFSVFEKTIIHQIVRAKSLEECPLAKVIDENSKAIALEWDDTHTKFKLIYFGDSKKHNEIFNQVQEIIYLIKTLEDEKFIYLHHNKDWFNGQLYNKKKYQRSEDGNYSLVIDNLFDFGGHLNTELTVNSDFGKLIQYYADSLFYATNALRDLVLNDFKTPEQVRFKEQLNDNDTKHKEAMLKAQKQIKYTQLAFFFSILTFIGSLVFGRIQTLSGTKIDQTQFNQIKQSIEKLAIPAAIKTELTNDTLVTKTVEKSKTKSAE